MQIDKDHITTQDELDEDAPIDQVSDRVDAEMKKLAGRAKRSVAEGLGNKQQKKEGKKLEEQGEKELADATSKGK